MEDVPVGGRVVMTMIRVRDVTFKDGEAGINDFIIEVRSPTVHRRFIGHYEADDRVIVRRRHIVTGM